MASQSFLDREKEGTCIEIKLYIKNLKLDRKKLDDINFNIFCGYTTENDTQKLTRDTYLYKGRFMQDRLVIDDLCLLSINIVEKTTNELNQICFRNLGNIAFKIIELYKKNGINTRIDFEKVPIHNHCVDDEIHLESGLKDQKNRIIGEISGMIIINCMNNDKIIYTKKFINYNELILKKYINPWYDQLDKLAPKGPIVSEISDYHVPIFRLLSGSILPFSYSLLWKNRYFTEGFENDLLKCQKFMDVITNLIDASVYFHTEFENTNDFFRKCLDFINNDTVDNNALSCIDVIVNILNIKTSSEPYISDEVFVPGLNKKISIDQMSNVNDIYGCDCEDGGKYAYELKRLICESDWFLILKTMNNSPFVKNIMDTVVAVLRMMCAFMTVMYCANGICHVVMVLIDWQTTVRLCNIQSRSMRNKKVLSVLSNNKILFVETTAYSSPFQSKFSNDDLEKARKKKYQVSNLVSNEMEKSEFHSTEVYSVNPYFKNSAFVSTFYKYFTNMMTTELLDIYPNVLDFLPITNEGFYGFSLNDFAYKNEALSLVPRISPKTREFVMMNEIILAQLPSYDIFPNDQAINDDSLFTYDAVEKIISIFERNIQHSDILKHKYIKNDISQINVNEYVRVNIYTIDLLKQKDDDRFYLNILSRIEDVFRKNPIFYHFNIRIKRIYSTSKQTIVVNIFFYYINNDEKIILSRQKEFMPKRHRQRGRK